MVKIIKFYIILTIHYSVFSLVSVSIEKNAESAEDTFVHTLSTSKFRQKHTTTPRIFNFLLGV